MYVLKMELVRNFLLIVITSLTMIFAYICRKMEEIVAWLISAKSDISM